MIEKFKIIGLNRKSKTGIYATVEYGKEDWFHSDFDSNVFSIEKQYSIFDMFKNSDVNLWSGRTYRATVEFDGYSSGGVPVNPIIKEFTIDI